MREMPDARRKRIELSVPQVAGSALAAVVAAKMASYFGVYGTILGAGVVSVVATCGGPLFQHFFRRTGEQLREKTTTASRPVGRQAAQVPPSPGEFTPGTVYRARARSWQRPALAVAVVFGVTMGGITAYELVSGSSFSGGRGTTVSDAVAGRGPFRAKSEDVPAPSHTPSVGRTPDAHGGTARGATPTPTPDGSPSGESSPEPSGEPSAAPAGPTPVPGRSSASPTPPEPSASSRSGTAVPGQDGPAAP
ncbi:hypothetical protein [Streptomyces sp. NPDC002671]